MQFRLRGDAGVVERSYADDVGAFKSWGVTLGQDRSFESALCGVARAMLEGNLQGLGFPSHPLEIPRPP